MLTLGKEAQQMLVRQKELLIPNWPQKEIQAFKDFSVDELIGFVKAHFHADSRPSHVIEVCYAIYLLRKATDETSANLMLEILENAGSWILSCYTMDSLSYRMAHSSENKATIRNILNRFSKHTGALLSGNMA